MGRYEGRGEEGGGGGGGGGRIGTTNGSTAERLEDTDSVLEL